MTSEIETINPQGVKTQSEQLITTAGGLILDWLPTLDLPQPRMLNEIIDRALVLNALFQLSMNAPKHYISNWINTNSLTHALTPKEKTLLSKPDGLSDNEQFELYWSLESLWALAWATNLIDNLPFDEEVGGELAALSPNLQVNENGYKYQSSMQLRPIKPLFEMLDLYYRLHWWTQTARKENKSTGNVLLEAVVARRRALEWILDKNSDWENVNLTI